MGNLLSGSSNFLNKHDLAEKGTVLDITNVEYKNAEVGSKFKDQWIISVRDAQTQVDLGVIGFPAATESRNTAFKNIAEHIELNGPYEAVILKEIPSKTAGFNPFFALNDYQGPWHNPKSNEPYDGKGIDNPDLFE